MAAAANPIIPLKALKMDPPLQHPIDMDVEQITPLDNLEIVPDGSPTTLADARPIDEDMETNNVLFVREAKSDASSPDSVEKPVASQASKASTSAVVIPPSKWTPMCHPRMEEVAKEVDGEFLEHWGFPTEKAKKKFLGTGFSRVTCLFFPTALDDRLRLACRLLTILSLVDDLLEDMSFENGEAYNDRLMPVMQGLVRPNSERPVETMMWDIWGGMRACDYQLAERTLKDAFVFMRAQTDRNRSTMKNLGQYLEYREKDFGKALLSSLMCFTAALHLTPEEHTSIRALDGNCAKQMSIVNDICSWENELQQSRSGHAEGSALCCAVQIIADEADLGIPSAKKLLWAMAREWSERHDALVARREADPDGCSDAVRADMKGLEYQMSGNEEWSLSTLRYIGLEPDRDERF